MGKLVSFPRPETSTMPDRELRPVVVKLGTQFVTYWL
jgi:hypothetical protein